MWLTMTIAIALSFLGGMFVAGCWIMWYDRRPLK
jgi:hypothetical protein